MARSTRTRIARDLRRRQTHAEALLWQHLRASRLDGIRFRRQHPIGPYFVDFACVSLRLVVELDGAVHEEDDRQLADHYRQAEIEQLGWFVLRFTNEQVIHSLTVVLSAIRDQARLAGAVNPLPPIDAVDGPLPLPLGEGFRKRRIPRARLPQSRP